MLSVCASSRFALIASFSGTTPIASDVVTIAEPTLEDPVRRQQRESLVS
ncbi:hypothetical protein RCH21_000792 [Arthrobacter sp. PL16]|nr:hypothetical protein [Arthrobacter sp. PL16]